MAANPLPRPRAETPTFTVNAATVTGNIPSTGHAVAGNTIDWTLTSSEPQTHIQVSAVNAKYPLDKNDFYVYPPPAGPGSVLTTVADAPANSYTFSRNGAAAGHIVVGGGGMPKPTRAK